ncbi:Protein VACUOLELESS GAMETOPHYTES [Cardamine amara subsp. amara]|uniref:Protein VACUOLELESS GAMETOPHYTES n=1 Tax=Cardamine amara subsp. amara TaxID=228776 RepID=A0ABD0ZAT5_CARAN
MNSDGGFHVMERNGKLFLVYHHPKYQPIQQTQSSIPSGEAANNDNLLQPLFLCPFERYRKQYQYLARYSDHFPINSSPEYEQDDHPAVPHLFWCNKKEFEVNGGCDICKGSDFGTDYYLCDHCDRIYHKECVESPVKIKHPYHPEHSLQLYFYWFQTGSNIIECLCCGRIVGLLVYYCTICEVFMHPICAMKPILFTIDPPKKHDHPLTYFPRQNSLTCNVCGSLSERYPTYVCLRCNFVAHRYCMYSPHVIKISRHHHRISYISSLQSREWFCWLCRRSIDHNYGAYTCKECGDYAVHLKCALGKDVWDGEELEGVAEKDDITQDMEPFDMIYGGGIFHFLHDHHLWLEVSKLYDESKFCQACVLPIFEGNYYSCKDCYFFLHETCAKARRRVQHALHPHILELEYFYIYTSYPGYLQCDACHRNFSGFFYRCHFQGCRFKLDVQCASISEPFDYKGHKHPLLLALNQEEKLICHICKTICHKQLNCITCDFIVCIKCATLPYKAKYQYDTHVLQILHGDEVCEKSWCEVCEHDLGDMSKQMLYWCHECYTTFHIECLLGEDLYLKPGSVLVLSLKFYTVLQKNQISRPYCDFCKNRCKSKILKRGNIIACSMKCIE